MQRFENYRLPDGLSAGDICSIENGSGGFGIVKILALEPGAVHIRLYKEKFASRPDFIDATGLSLGTVHDEDGFGIGHLPLSARNFAQWEPMISVKRFNSKLIWRRKMRGKGLLFLLLPAIPAPRMEAWEWGH